MKKEMPKPLFKEEGNFQTRGNTSPIKRGRLPVIRKHCPRKIKDTVSHGTLKMKEDVNFPEKNRISQPLEEMIQLAKEKKQHGISPRI